MHQAIFGLLIEKNQMVEFKHFKNHIITSWYLILFNFLQEI